MAMLTAMRGRVDPGQREPGQDAMMTAEVRDHRSADDDHVRALSSPPVSRITTCYLHPRRGDRWTLTEPADEELP
jgi:hypothetical protein